MADATRLQALSKQNYERKQHSDELDRLFASLEASWTKTLSQGSWNSPIHIQEFNSSPSDTLNTYPRPPQPPDPPDCKSHTEFPKFDGTLLREWIRRCDEYFYLHKTPPEMRVRVASPHMIGKALQWHTVFIRNNFGIFPPWLDYVIALSAKFDKLSDDPLSQLMSLKQHDDSVEIYFAKFERALSRLTLPVAQALNIFLTNMSYHLASHVRQFDVTTVADAVWIAKRCESSLLQHSSTTQNRAPFSPYQNYNDQPYYEREFGKCPEIEFDRESDEIKDEKLQDKQPEEDVKIPVMSENEQSLECVGDEPSDDEKPSEVTVEESIDKSVDMIQEDTSTPENESSLEVSPQILLSQLRIFDDESQGTFGDHTLAPMKPYQSYSQSWYELDTIHSDINFTVLVSHECDVVSAVVVIYEVATTFEKLAKTWKFKFKSNPERSKLLDDMFSFMEKLSEKYVMVWESQQGNGLSLLNCLIDHDVLRPWICLGLYNSSLEAKLELSGWKYKKQINQGQICLNGLCNELVCDKEKKRESIEFNECHNRLKKLQAALLEGIPQKIAGGLIYGDVEFHLKHKWRSRLEFCIKTAILFTSSVKLLFPKNHKLLHYEVEFCAQYNDLKQLSTEFQSFPGLDYFAYLIFLWNQTLNCGCEAGHTSSGFFSVGDVYGFFTCSKLQTGDETQEKRLLFLNNNDKVDHTIKENWFHSEPMIREVYHLQRPPELIELQGNPNFITKVLVQWKEHPPDQFFSGSQWQEFNFSSLRTRMFRRGKYCDRIFSNPGSHKPDFSQSLLFMVQL